MSSPYKHAAIIGVGLLGASVGLGLKKHGLAKRVTGIGRRQESLDIARKRGAVDDADVDIGAIEGADLVVIATPAARVTHDMDQVHGLCGDKAVITDVASTKAAICAHAAARWPPPRRFVGSHPMAGSEKHGPEHAREDFYRGSVCLMEPLTDQIDPEAHAAVCALWEALGAEVAYIAPRHHDQILARTSHLPHVVASALAINVLHSPGIEKLVGNGFRDTTRIADSRPEIWRDICLTNRDALIEAIEDFRGVLDAFEESLKSHNETSVEGLFDEGRRARREVLGE